MLNENINETPSKINTMTRQELLNLKANIEEAKIKASELTGRKTQLLKQLKNDWNCADIDQAEDKLQQLEQQIEKLNKQFNEGTAKVEEEINNHE